ncbi:MAG TPA: type II toxin-antitoxin system Y4mF family antitoxin [Ignavibacteria bacterium]|nr:type II toxin-antitoxin system Y4mF family antitoxin [Ignavibacteria bacterium]
MKNGILADFVKKNRKLNKLTQEELAKKAGVGLRFIRELEHGKNSVQIETVNKVLKIFGSSVAPVKIKDLKQYE